jgi:hypothetical protein
LAADNTTLALGNGSINGGDVTQAQRYAVNLDGGTTAAGGPTGPPPPSNAGEQITNARGKSIGMSPEAADMYEVRAVRQSLTASTVTIAIQLDTSAGAPQAAAVSGTLRFVTTEIGTPTNIRLGSGAPAGTSFFVNDTDTASGRLGFTINAPVNQTFGDGQQQLLLIDFTIVGSGSTALSFDDSQAERFVGDANGNQTTAPVTFSNNTVTLSPTAAPISLAGQVVATDGRAVAKALVTITGADGTSRTIMSNSFGYFRFSDLEVGQYVVSARHKTFEFTPQVVGAQSSVEDLRLEAHPRK